MNVRYWGQNGHDADTMRCPLMTQSGHSWVDLTAPYVTLGDRLTVLPLIDLSVMFGRGRHMRRREFITTLGGAVSWPFAAWAQQPAGTRRVGVLINLSENDLEAQRLITAFRERLAQLGWVDGRNLRVDYRWASGDVDRISAFAKELVELSPDVIVGYATPSVMALQHETGSIPIVFLSVTDPLGQGLVASLAHPGGNITGFAVFEFSLGTKWVETLKQISPNLKRVTTIFNPKTAPYYSLYLRAIEKAASSLAIEPIVVEIHDDAEIERAISTSSRYEPNGGLVLPPDVTTVVDGSSPISSSPSRTNTIWPRYSTLRVFCGKWRSRCSRYGRLDVKLSCSGGRPTMSIAFSGAAPKPVLICRWQQADKDTKRS